MTERRAPGILRRDVPQHTVVTTNHTELLVFGYQCKVYRDDEKALWVDQGKHLIPCPSNATLLVDRYDVRGALSDLAKHEAIPGGYGDRLACLSLAEKRAEELCDAERYWSLYNHDVNEELYQDTTPAAGDQQQNGSGGGGVQIGFNYNNADQDQNVPQPAEEEEPNEPFVASQKFYIPPGMTVPETMKQQRVIEKTAKFIASQGIQMEILLKAKQSNNPQFAFLMHDDTLNPYYKHMLDAIKSNNYPMEEEAVVEPKPAEPVESSGVSMENMIAFEPRPSPVIKYEPTEDCVYFKLMNSIGKISGIPTPAPVNGNNSPGQDTPLATPATASATKNPPITGLRGLMEYISDTESDEDQETFDGPLPPDSIIHIIDRTVVYVNKNGTEFENSIIAKKDPRFEFLTPGHEYHAYYQFKLHGKPPDIIKASKVVPKEPAPVSFSIKESTTAPKLLPTARGTHAGAETDDDETDDDDDENGDISKYDIANVLESNKTPTPTPVVVSDIERKIQEARRVEEQIRDRLTARARERMNALSKEKLLQLERQKRARAFLSTLKEKRKPESTETTAAAAAAPPPAPSFPAAPPVGPISYPDSDTSVHSIPLPEAPVEISSESEDERARKKRRHKSEKERKRSRSRSRSRSRHNKKKSKKTHKKKSKRSTSDSSRSSRSRSRSSSRSRSRSRHKRHRR